MSIHDDLRIWNSKMHKRGLLSEVFWFLDKRLFRWDHLPSLARISFVQKSYLLLLIIPFADQIFSPLFQLPQGARVEIDLGWVYIVPQGLKLSFELGMPFSWKLIYFLVLFLGIGSAINEVFSPRILGNPTRGNISRQLVMQNFREVANGILLAPRANHIIYNFVTRYTENSGELMKIPEAAINDSRKTGENLVSVQQPDSRTRTNKYSVYYIAEHLKFRENVLDDALETLLWFLNETRLFARWICGTCFIISIALFIVLVGQGLQRVLL